MIQAFLATKVGRWLAGAVAALVALAGIFFAGKREGRQNANEAAKRKDAERALETKEKADAALRDRDTGRSVDERLRDHGRLRD